LKAAFSDQAGLDTELLKLQYAAKATGLSVKTALSFRKN
jgi:hypothetical protein